SAPRTPPGTPNANRSRWPAASPARCCCSRGSTTRWCRRSSRPPSPRRCRSAACPAPIWPSRAKGTASAAPRPAPPRSPPNSLSTSRSSCDGSARELRRPRLPHHRDPHLPRVGALLFRLLGLVAGAHLRLAVVDLVRLAHDPDLPPGLHGEVLLHAVVGLRDLRQPLQPLHVRLQRLAAGARPAAADRVGRL